MSLDAGGLAQMTYNNNFSSNGGLGMPTAGFASRGKAAQLKRLSVNAPSHMSENQAETVATPRTARGHLLAGLRTAPKTPTPASAPFGQTQHRVGLDTSRFVDGGNHLHQQNYNVNGAYGRATPQTASAATFSSAGYNQQFNGLNQHQMYPLLEQPLAPPVFNLNAQEMQQMDPEILADMMRQSLYLEQKRKLLEHQIQLINLQAQHAQGLTFNPLLQQLYPATPLSPTSAMFGLANPNAGALLEEALAQEANAGNYAIWNGQNNGYNNYVMGGSGKLASSPPPPTPGFSSTPPHSNTPTFRAEVSPPSESMGNPFERRTPSPPKSTPTPPRDVTPLPPTSSNGWRRGHKKVPSLGFNGAMGEVANDGPKSAMMRPVGMPQTPVTGTFGPGQGRAGEHPIRQPRGPPPMDELIAAPTTKHEGSKNFAARQRRGALSKLVRAGMERRGGRTGSAGSMTPVSETDPIFSLAGSDNDSDSGRSLSGKPSIGSLRAKASGAIGSERKERKERSRERAEASEEESSASQGERKKMPMLVLTSAEKRKSSTMF